VNSPISGGFYGEFSCIGKSSEEERLMIGIACDKTLRYGPAVQVFYKPKFITTPMGCADVELVVEGV